MTVTRGEGPGFGLGFVWAFRLRSSLSFMVRECLGEGPCRGPSGNNFIMRVGASWTNEPQSHEP